MLAQLSQWILIATLSQSPQEAAWLKVIPADVDIAIRSRGIDATRTDLVAMLKAMSPAWGDMAENALAGPLGQVEQMHGELALKAPWVGVLRFSDGGGDGGPPAAVLILSEDYKGVLKALSGGKDPELKHEEGGYDAFDGPGGHGTWYAAKGTGIVAIGPAKGLIASIARPSGKTLDVVLKGSTAKPFLAGDLGVYVNAAALTTHFADQIEQGRQAFMGLMDQAAAQQPAQEGMMNFVKDFYGGLFDSIKYADVVVLGLDVAEKGLHLTGMLNVKPDAPAAKTIGGIHTSTSATLASFPPGSMLYMYMDMDSKTFERLQGMSLRMLGSGKPSPELEKAVAVLHGLGRVESTGSAAFDKNGMSVVNDITVSDPKKYLAASEAMLRAMKGTEGHGGFFKEVKVEPDVQTFQGLTFTRIVATMDFDKLAELAGNNPAQVENMKSMFGGGTATYWYGTDGKTRLLQVMTPTWEDVKAKVGGYLKGEPGVGANAGFKAVRSELPEQTSLLVLFEVQSFLKMVVGQLATTLHNPDLKLPDHLSKDPVFLGGSMTPRPPLGYEFHLVIPTSVGTLIDKGLIPVFQGLQPGGVKQ
jgi:hypothetical protein